MARIEKGSGLKEEVEQMKGEMKKEIAATKPKGRFRSCSFIFFLFVFLLILIGSWSVASTGLVEIPLLSQIAYHTPQPERVVTPGVPVETIVNEQLKTTLLHRLQEGGGTLKDKSLALELSESSVTASLRTLIEKENNKTMTGDMIDSASTQVSISKETGFTFFLPVSNSPKKTVVIISVKATVNNGVIELIPERFVIGSFSVPRMLISFFLKPFIQSALDSLNQTIGSVIKIQALEYQDGFVTIKGDFSGQVTEVKK